MFKKRILLVAADASTLADFQNDLGNSWEINASANGTAAFAEIEKQPCDIVVIDATAAESDGLDLLNRLQLSQPKTIRFILALETERERVMKKALGAHQFLSKPLVPGSIKQAFERALALEAWIPRNSIRELVARVRTLPTIPSLYLEVQALLKSPDATTEEVGAVIAKDMAMMTKLLQVLNSAAFALQRKITNPTEAVGILGFETVSSMVMAIKVLGEYDKVKPVYFSIDKLWKHSTDVARIAKELTLMHTGDRALGELAFTGGLMHDLGKVVLAANFDEQYRGAQSLARKQNLPVWEVEKEIFGATHGEMGAYLLGLWGMPLEVLEVAALHHSPVTDGKTGFTVLTAVHVANALEHEAHSSKDDGVVSKIDEAYLTQAGVLDYLPQWRHAVATRNFHKTEVKPKPAVASTASAPKPLVKTQRIPSARRSTPVASIAQRNKWGFPMILAGAAAALLLWLGCELFLGKAGSGAKTGTASSVLTAIMPTEIVHARTDTNLSETTSTNALAPVKELVVKNPSVSAVSTSATHYGTNFEDLKLQGIFYSAKHPQAIINGKTLYPGDRLGEIKVVSVSASSVTLEYKKQTKVLTLK